MPPVDTFSISSYCQMEQRCLQWQFANLIPAASMLHYFLSFKYVSHTISINSSGIENRENRIYFRGATNVYRGEGTNWPIFRKLSDISHLINNLPGPICFWSRPRLKLGYVSSKSGLITFLDGCDLELTHHGEGGQPSEDYAFQLTAGIFHSILKASKFTQKTNENFHFPTIILWYFKFNCFHSFFGRIEDTKRTFQNLLNLYFHSFFKMDLYTIFILSNQGAGILHVIDRF